MWPATQRSPAEAWAYEDSRQASWSLAQYSVPPRYEREAPATYRHQQDHEGHNSRDASYRSAQSPGVLYPTAPYPQDHPYHHSQYLPPSRPQQHHAQTSHYPSSLQSPGPVGNNSGMSSFHPYQPKARPLLFVNTVPPASSSATGPPPDANVHLKPKRKRITPEQFVALTELFSQTDSPSHAVREKLGAQLEMTNREVQVWFQNRRAKMNRLKTQPAAAVEGAAPKTQASETTSKPASFEDSPWQHRATTTTVVDVSQSSSSSSAFRLPQRTQSDPIASTAPISPSAQPFSPFPQQRPAQTGRSRPRPCLPPIKLPDRGPYASLHPSPGHPASAPLSSPYSNARSPPLSASFPFGTPGITSPSFSSSGSSYFSSTDATTPSQYTPSSISSPNGTFFRLSLDSPGMTSPRSECGGSAVVEGREFPFIRLPPLLNGERRIGQGHVRSSSDSVAREHKLPSFQTLVDSVSPRPPSPGEQFSGVRPMSATSTRDSHSSSGTQRPVGVESPSLARGGAPPVARSQPPSRRPAHHRTPSGLSAVSQAPPITEEEDMPAAVLPEHESARGLGMLAIAASEVDASDLKRTAVYTETRKMSYSA